MKAPVLFIIFNRPETTKKVFFEIKRYKPKKLYIAADGPRLGKSGEKERCVLAREITQEVNWPCQVKRLYHKNNLGCRVAVSKAIDWFFQNEDQGIILEDDCLPSQRFFKYCSLLLAKYRNNKSIMHISGNSYVSSIYHSDKPYLSRYPHIWGWATWKRAWCKYNRNLTGWEKKFNNYYAKYTFSAMEKYYWWTLLKKVELRQIDTWDYQWLHTIWSNNGYAINPPVDLVENIGFIPDATHTKKRPRYLENNKDNPFSVRQLPKPVINDNNDRYTVKHIFNINLIHVIYLSLSLIIKKR